MVYLEKEEMMSPKIIYLITRVRGLRTHLLKRTDFEKLMAADSVKEVAEGLSGTDYSGNLAQVLEKVDASALEGIFLKKMVSRFFFISSISPSRVGDLILAYSRRFEVENLKRVMRAKHTGEEVEVLIPLTGRQTLVDFQALLESKTVEEGVKWLARTAYAPLADVLELYSEYKTTLVLESKLDRIYYEAVWQAAEKIRDRDVRRLLGMEIDVRNLFLALTMKSSGVNPVLIERFVIPTEGLEKRKLVAIAKAKIGEIQSILRGTPYAKATGDAVEVLGKKMGSHRAEAALFTLFYNEVKSTARSKPLSTPYVLAYLIQSELECKNLIAIAIAKQLKLSTQLLREIIFA